MSSVGAGIQSLNAVLITLTGIDDRMNNIEYEFITLKESTYVQNDIAVLYEKIMQLEMAASNLGRANEQLASMQTTLMDLEQDYYDLKYETEQALRDSGFDLERYYLLEKWEYQELNDSITRMETQVQTVNNNMWELNDLKTRLAYLEANNHQH